MSYSNDFAAELHRQFRMVIDAPFIYRGRLEYPDLRRIGLAAEHRATTVLIEDAGPGMNLLQDLRATMPGGMTRPIGVKPEGSKMDRMAAQSAKIEAGHVYLPKSAAWLGEFLTEGGIPVIADLNLDAADATAKEIRGNGRDAFAVAMNVADEAAVEKGVAD